MNIFSFLKREKNRCAICKKAIAGDDYDEIQYVVADREETQKMKICRACGDGLEERRQRPGPYESEDQPF